MQSLDPAANCFTVKHDDGRGVVTEEDVIRDVDVLDGLKRLSVLLANAKKRNAASEHPANKQKKK